MSYAARTALLRRLVAWMRTRRLDAAGKALLAEADDILAPGRGRPRKLTREQAHAAIAEHGTVVAAARALGVSHVTVMAARDLPESEPLRPPHRDG